MNVVRPAAAAASLLMLVGCRDIQSVLAPQGPQAGRIALLAWVLFGGAAAVLAIVLAALWLALRGPPAVRARLAARSTVLAGGVVFPAVTLTVLLGYGVWLMRAAIPDADAGPVVRIEVFGEQWWWRVGYAGADGRSVASANEIRIPAGRAVDFTLRSTDVIHSFWVPSLGGKVDMIPGRTTHLRLGANRPGVFRGQCAEYCGGPHALMALEVVAMPAPEFDAWLVAQARPAAEPATDEAGRGRALFRAAGCGGCHAIRGTEAEGTLGPDLTHLGGRQSVGVDTLPMNPANLAQFIADGQHIKRGNRMPPFRIFTAEELNALATYLVGLK